MSIAATKDATSAPADRSTNASVARSNTGRDTKGKIATVTAAVITTNPSERSSGRRSATLPPSQYPTERYSSVIPMTFAQTTFDVPKFGASSRAPVTSVPSVATPARNTTSPSRNRRSDMAGPADQRRIGRRGRPTRAAPDGAVVLRSNGASSFVSASDGRRRDPLARSTTTWRSGQEAAELGRRPPPLDSMGCGCHRVDETHANGHAETRTTGSGPPAEEGNRAHAQTRPPTAMQTSSWSCGSYAGEPPTTA